MSAVLARYRFNVDDYYRMAEIGILAADACVELIDGEIVEMAPIGVSHSSTTLRLAEMLRERLARRALIHVQGPLVLSCFSEPQPDICVLRYRDDYYGAAHPAAADVLWLIEISDTTLIYDRGVKLALYAQAGIAETWIVNLRERVLETYSLPRDGTYTQMQTIQPGESLRAAALPDELWETATLLGWTS